MTSKTILSPEKKAPVVKESENGGGGGLGGGGGSGGKACLKNADLISIDNDVHDNILLRRQQLTRVAEWVQNSSNIPLPNSPEQKSTDGLDIANNNAIASKQQNYAPANNQMLCDNNAQNCVSEKLNNDVCDESSNVLRVSPLSIGEQSSSSNKSDELNDDKIDLAQMEYNVKKFLLKQNEWSIGTRPLSLDPFLMSSVDDEDNDDEDDDDDDDDSNNDATIFIKNSYQRTETNL